MIGLVDYDLFTKSINQKLYFPNLEIMKLYNYYKNEKGDFCRLISPFEKIDIASYEKIYFCSNDIECEIPTVFRGSNIEFCGQAFGRGKYIPFQNELIDFMLPKIAIYQDFLQKKYKEDGVKSTDINRFLDSSYSRTYINGNILPLSPIRKGKRVILYDDIFFYDSWENVIDKIIEKKPITIIFINPIICSTIQEFIAMRNKSAVSRSNEFIWNFHYSDKEFKRVIDENKNILLGDIFKTTKVYLPIGGAQKSQLASVNDLFNKLNLLYYCWNLGLPVKLKYIKPNIGTKHDYKELFQKVEKWSSSFNDKTMNNPLRGFFKGESKKQYEEILKYFPNNEYLFSICFNKLSEGGYWRL